MVRQPLSSPPETGTASDQLHMPGKLMINQTFDYKLESGSPTDVNHLRISLLEAEVCLLALRLVLINFLSQLLRFTSRRAMKKSLDLLRCSFGILQRRSGSRLLRKERRYAVLR